MTPSALVLAAGKSTRIASVSGGRPKPLLEVSGKPVLAWNLDWLARHGVNDVWVNLHYRPDEIRDALGDGSSFGVRIRYSLEETILGTAGAWRHLGAEWKETTLVVYGDNLLRCDIDALLKTHRRRGALATVALFDPQVHANTQIAGGRVALGTEGHVLGFVEGGAVHQDDGARHVNAGVYVLEPALLDRIGAGFQDFGRDVFPGLVRTRELVGHVIEPSGYCLGLDTPASFHLAESLISTRQVALV